MRAKISKTRRGQTGLAQSSVLGGQRGTTASPHARIRKIPPSSTAVKPLDTLRPCSMAGSGNLDRKLAFVLACLCGTPSVAERRETLKPPLYSCLMVAHFADAFERLVIRKGAKRRTSKVTLKYFDGPHNDASFQVERILVAIQNRGQCG